MKNIDIQPKFRKLKKIIKQTFIVLGFFLGFVLLQILCLWLLIRIFGVRFWRGWKIGIIVAFVIIIPILLISFTLSLIKLIKSQGNKKRIKSVIIIDIVIIFLIILGRLTKLGIIPNYLGIKALCNCIYCERITFRIYEGCPLESKRKECCDGELKVYYDNGEIYGVVGSPRN